jgi:hypothetical protein
MTIGGLHTLKLTTVQLIRLTEVFLKVYDESKLDKAILTKLHDVHSIPFETKPTRAELLEIAQENKARWLADIERLQSQINQKL